MVKSRRFLIIAEPTEKPQGVKYSNIVLTALEERNGHHGLHSLWLAVSSG
jgi:hypothetical protein